MPKRKSSGARKMARRSLVAMGVLALLVSGLSIANPEIAQAAVPSNCDAVLNTSILLDCYFYVGAKQNLSSAPKIGAYAYMNQYAPSLEDASDHSLAEIAVVNNLGNNKIQSIEVGWIVAPDMFGGDPLPHLFVFTTNGTQQQNGCWITSPSSLAAGCAWHQSSTKPGHAPGDSVNITSTLQGYGILYTGGNWWINYQNDWIGYIPGSLWGGTFTSFRTALWYGEVEYIYPDSTQPDRCDQMGSGAFGSRSGSAEIWTMGLWDSQFHTITAAASQFITAPNAYNMGSTTAGRPISQFSYGGPGNC